MDYLDAWNYLCEEHQKGINKLEAAIQRDWENYFADPELFGYSKSKKDINPQVKLILGSTEREIPDILISRDAKKIFLVELKTYSTEKEEEIEKQLLSYLTHVDVHLSVGIIACKNLYIYCYDFVQNAKVMLEIPFEKDNENGIKFMELFCKQNFDEKKIQDFILAIHLSAQHISEIKEAISSELIVDLLKKHFLEKFSEEEIEKALRDTEINVERKEKTYHIDKQVGLDIGKPKDGKKTVTIKGVVLPIYRRGGSSVQDFVKETLKTLFSHNLLPIEELKRMQDLGYCSQIFDLKYPILQKEWNKCLYKSEKTGKIHPRYWGSDSSKKIGGFYICSQWWKGNFPKYDEKIAAWLCSLENDL
ncbi:MAG: hypothetical protein K5751_02010 [Treponemataceae bacterium]|nr:hypothetical protein [Treponemataceae bacterium]